MTLPFENSALDGRLVAYAFVSSSLLFSLSFLSILSFIQSPSLLRSAGINAGTIALVVGYQVRYR